MSCPLQRRQVVEPFGDVLGCDHPASKSRLCVWGAGIVLCQTTTMSCKHDNITPNTHDPTKGTCQDCGDSTFVLCDPEYDACSVMESLKDYPNDAARRRFLGFLRRNVDLSTGALKHAQGPRRTPAKGGSGAGTGCRG